MALDSDTDARYRNRQAWELFSAKPHLEYSSHRLRHHRAHQPFLPNCAHQLAQEWQDRRYRIYSPHVLSDQYVHQDQFLSIFPCAVLRNVTAMKGDAKLSRETPGVSDSCTTRRGSSGRCIWNAAAGILDGFRATGGTGGPPPGQFFLGPRRILLRAPRTKLPVKSRCRRPLMCRWQWVPR